MSDKMYFEGCGHPPMSEEQNGTPTPRTDAGIKKQIVWDDGGGDCAPVESGSWEYVEPSFARQLERELAEARAEAIAEHKLWHKARLTALHLDQENAELRRLCEGMVKIIKAFLYSTPLPICEHLHHSKRDQHGWDEPCKPFEKAKKAREDAEAFIAELEAVGEETDGKDGVG